MGTVLDTLTRLWKFVAADRPLTREEQRVAEDNRERSAREERLRKEQDRKAFEKYRSRSIGFWGCLPLLLSLALGFLTLGVFIYNLIATKTFALSVMNISLFVLFIIVGLVGLMPYNMEAEWQERLSCKRRLNDKNCPWSVDNYDDDYIYTDSAWSATVHATSRIFAYIITLGIPCLGVILFFNLTKLGNSGTGAASMCLMWIVLAWTAGTALCQFTTTEYLLLRLEREKIPPNIIAEIAHALLKSRRDCLVVIAIATLVAMSWYHWPVMLWQGTIIFGVLVYYIWATQKRIMAMGTFKGPRDVHP